MTAVFGTPKAWFFNKKSQKKFRIELLGLLLAITALIETGSMAGILEKLKWESIMKRRRDSRLIILYKGLKGAQHSSRRSYPPQLGAVETIARWLLRTPLQELIFIRAHSSLKQWDSSALPDSIITSVEGAEDGVRARD